MYAILSTLALKILLARKEFLDAFQKFCPFKNFMILHGKLQVIDGRIRIYDPGGYYCIVLKSEQGFYFNDTFVTSVSVDISLNSVLCRPQWLWSYYGCKCNLTYISFLSLFNSLSFWLLKIFNRVVITAPGGTGYFEVRNIEFTSLNKSHVTYKGDCIIQHAFVFYYTLELDATQWFDIS